MNTETGAARLRSLAVLTAAIVALAVAVLLLTQSRLRSKKAGPPEKITIAHSTLPYAALAQIAQVSGFYRQEGLDATPHRFAYGKLALEAVMAGKADVATVAETPVMLAIMNGADLSILATIHTSTRSHAIVARKDRGIVVPEDLKGKRIGTTVGTSGEFFLDAYVLQRGISRKDVKVVDLKPDDIPGALKEGDIDAVSTWAPFLMQSQKKAGDRGVTFYDDNIYTLTFNLVATREYTRKNPGKVKKMLKALIQAEEFARRDPSEAQRIVADFNNIDLATLKELWSFSTFVVKLDQALLLALEDESRWALRNGLTERKAVPNYLEFIYLDGLQAVKPAAVGILR